MKCVIDGMKREPHTTYAVADFVDGVPGSSLRLARLTVERGVVIWLGLQLAPQGSDVERAMAVSGLMSTWIALDYWLAKNGYGGMAFYS